MTRTRRATLLVGVIGTLLCAGLLGQVAADSPSRLGRVFHEVPGAPGQFESRGIDFAGGDVVRSVNLPALLRLDNGHVLRLNANSAVLVEELASDEVQVKVLSGRVLAVGNGGRLHVVGRGSLFRRGPTLADPLAAERLLSGGQPVDGSGRREVDRD